MASPRSPRERYKTRHQRKKRRVESTMLFESSEEDEVDNSDVEEITDVDGHESHEEENGDVEVTRDEENDQHISPRRSTRNLFPVIYFSESDSDLDFIDDSDSSLSLEESDDDTTIPSLSTRSSPRNRVPRVLSQPHDLGDMDKVCTHCNAMFFQSENDRVCCRQGAIIVQPPECPVELKRLFQRDLIFRKNIRKLNSSLAFSRSIVTLDKNHVGNNGGSYVYRIQGSVTHAISSTMETELNRASHAQLYILDPDEAKNIRMEFMDDMSLSPLLSQLTDILQEHNPYAEMLTNWETILTGPERTQELSIEPMKSGRIQERVFDTPQVAEVAALMTGAGWERDVVFKRRGEEGLQFINSFSSLMEPLHFVLLFPKGEHGYYPIKPHGGTGVCAGKHLTGCQYARYLLQSRVGQFNHILAAGKLFHEYVVILYATVDAYRIWYFVKNQPKMLRSKYKEWILWRAANPMGDPKSSPNCPIILPSSHVGSPRFMRRLYQNAMTVVRKFGKPTFFLTMTANPNWKEIQNQLSYGQTAADRPDIVCRVFYRKMLALKDVLMSGTVLGPVHAVVLSVEFQKRGLPHCHVLIISQQGIHSPDELDRFISAEIPNRELHPERYEIVTKCLIHGPCQNKPCWKENEKTGVMGCNRDFPRPFANETTIAEDHVATYRRRDEPPVRRNGRDITNAWVVPYSPILVDMFQCHINLEFVSSVATVKYIYKYIFKGQDMLRAVLKNPNNEVEAYLMGRYLTAPEAIWRLFEFKTHFNSCSVVLLDIHLPDEHMVVMEDSVAPTDDFYNTLAESTSMLMQFFHLNTYTDHQVLYTDVTETHVWRLGTDKKKNWYKRDNGAVQKNALARLPLIHPSKGDLYYLRQLLCHVKSPKGFRCLRTVDGYVHPTFQDACIALNIIHDDLICSRSMTEASNAIVNGDEVRRFFLLLLIHTPPLNPNEIFQQHLTELGADLDPQQIGVSLSALVKWKLKQLCIPENKTITGLGLHDLTEQEIEQLRRFHIHESLGLEMEQLIPVDTLNEEQKVIHTLVTSNSTASVMIDAPGGTGKTHVLKSIISSFPVGTVITVASSGIAALCFANGMTAHSRFKIPIEADSSSTCTNVTHRSQLAGLLRQAKVIIWDEVSQVSKYTVECVNKLLKFVNSSSEDFGGVKCVFSGDYRQILPILKHATDGQVMAATFKKGNLWSKLTKVRLSQNMRVQQGNDDWCNYLLQLGEGKIPQDEDGYLELPETINAVDDLNDLIEEVYDNGLTDLSGEEAILATTNDSCDEINRHCLKKVQVREDQMKTYLSFDSMSERSALDAQVGAQFLNKFSHASLPPHELNLKVGCPVMCIRNLSRKDGLMNGTRLTVRSLGERIIRAEIRTEGPKRGRIVNIPRIILESGDGVLPFVMRRQQFPLKVCYAMTINKSQCQTLSRMGLYLTEQNQCFTHGQLYVALSRVSQGASGITLFGSRRVRNVVIKEILF